MSVHPELRFLCRPCLCFRLPTLQASALWKSGLGEGFRVPALLRFVNEEEPYLAMSSGGPRMYLNMEDHVSHSLKKPNIPLEVRISTCPVHP